MQFVLPVIVALVFAALMSLVREPHRRTVNALLIAGAGGVYFGSGNTWPWEFPFAVAMLYVAYRGLSSWKWIGAGWLLHAAWDVVHVTKGSPILPFAHDSSLGCAICDPVIAVWCLGGGRTPRELVHSVRIARSRPA